MPIRVEDVEAIFFDVDGTLNDTDDQFVDRIARIIQPIAFLLPGRDPRNTARKLVMDLETPANFILGFLDRIGVDDEIGKWGGKIRRILGLRRDHTFNMIPLIDETLQTLKDHYTLAIVSARDRLSTMSFLQQYNLKSIFQCVVTAHTTPRSKPHPSPILWAADRLNIPIEACLMVGDTTVDIKSGKSAGCQTVGVLSGFGKETELREAGADMILPTVNELLDILPLTRPE